MGASEKIRKFERFLMSSRGHTPTVPVVDLVRGTFTYDREKGTTYTPNKSFGKKKENDDYAFAKQVFEAEEGRKPDMNNPKDSNCVAMLQVGVKYARIKYEKK